MPPCLPASPVRRARFTMGANGAEADRALAQGSTRSATAALPTTGSLSENGVSANGEGGIAGGSGGGSADLLDLADIFGGGATPAASPAIAAAVSGNDKSGGTDLLAHIFAGTATLTPSAGGGAPAAASILPVVIPAVVPAIVPAASGADFGGLEEGPPRKDTIVVSLAKLWEWTDGGILHSRKFSCLVARARRERCSSLFVEVVPAISVNTWSFSCFAGGKHVVRRSTRKG